MKSKIAKTIASISIFILLITIMIFVINPLYKRINGTIRNYEEKLVLSIRNSTNLDISYDSMDPSIFSKIQARGICITEAGTKKEILKIKKASIKYSMMKMLKKDYQHAFSKVTITDVDADLDSETLEKLGSKSEKKEKKEDDFGHITEQKLSEIEKMISENAFLIPFDVQVQRVNLKYREKNEKYALSLREVNFKKDKKNSSLFISINGSAITNLRQFGYKSAGLVFSVEGNIPSSIQNSFFKIRIDDNRKAQYSVRRNNFLVNYKNSSVTIRPIQRKYPFSIYASYKIISKDIHATLSSEKFNPLSLIRAPYYNGAIEFFSGSLLTSDLAFNMNLGTLLYSWSGSAAVDFSKKISEKGQKLSISASGNNNDIYISSLEAEGEFFQGTFSGEFNIPNLQPSGMMNLEHYAFMGKRNLSCEVFFEPTGAKEFMMFIPELNFGGMASYTAFQAYITLGKQIELSFETLDYSHSEYETPGKITGEASLQLGDNKFLSATATLDNFFVDTGLKTAAFFTDVNDVYVGNKIQTFKPYISHVEAYFSTDFNEFTYNSPFTLFANTEKSKEIVILSFDGSNNSLQLSNIDLIFGNNAMKASGGLDYSSREQLTFFTDLNVNSMPYTLNGNYTYGKWLNITGNYGLDVAINFDSMMNGTIRFDSFPISSGKYTAAFSLDSVFEYENTKSWNAFISDFRISEITENLRSKPVFSLSGELNQSALIASSISYADSMTSLSGEGYALWNMESSVFDYASVNFNMASQISGEMLNAAIEITNPVKKKFDTLNPQKDIFFNSEINLEKYPFGRFFAGQTENDTISATISANGTVENPYIAVNIRESSFAAGGKKVHAVLEASYLENMLNISNSSVSWGNITLKDIATSINIGEFSGEASLDLQTKIKDMDYGFKMNFLLSNLSGKSENFLPEAYSIEMECTEIMDANEGRRDKASKKTILGKDPIHVSLLRSPGRFDLMTDEHIGAYGELLDNGKVSLSVEKTKPLRFNMNGIIKENKINIDVENIFCDLGHFSHLFNSDYLTVYNANLEGNLNLSGIISDPDLDGRLVAYDVDFNMPQFVTEHLKTDEFHVDFSQDELSIPQTYFTVGSGKLSLDAFISLNRWTLETLSVNLETKKRKDIPIDSKVSYFRINGYTGLDVNLLMENNEVSVTGSVGLRDAELSLNMDFSGDKTPSSAGSSSDNMDFSIDMDFFIGKKVQVIINPLLRSLVAPSTPISVTADSSTGLWSVRGDIVLRGGEVSYLSRNFYLKQGRLILNETQNSFDPIVTLRAETREHDLNGDPVTISLSAINQNVSKFNAILSSTPAKSENEIMEILGQIAKGDTSSASNLLVAGIDYGVQVTLLRKLETALRDLCNFDIFSVRTTILQNTIMQNMEKNNSAENNSVVSNLFGNSTVYIGKYFGNDIYFDALFHWSFDEKKSDSSGSSSNQGIIFHPELGLEFDAPFADIRWGFAPDFEENFLQSWTTQSTSLTLSWHLEL